jgi:hypothetical protein
MGGHEVDGSHDPTDGQREEGAPAGREFGRRSVLKGIAGAGALLGAGRSVDNVLLGYGVLVGTNLREQDLGTLADEGFHSGGRSIPAGTHEIHAGPREVRIAEGGATVAAFDPIRTDPGDAEAIGTEHGLGGATSELARDLGALAAGDHAFEFHGIDEFFERVRGVNARPYTAGAMRRWPWIADADRVERFVEANPEQPEAVLEGLASGFRERTHYDVGRYVAGAVQDNVVMGAADLRAPFREPVGFEALLDDDGGTGMFCYEFTHRSIEALHAAPAPEQAVPVIGARVIDDRHKHVYTGVASVIRDGGLRVPMTFVDYTHATLYDDFNARGLLGDGVEAYDDRHRATAIEWAPF